MTELIVFIGLLSIVVMWVLASTIIGILIWLVLDIIVEDLKDGN